MRIRRGLIVVCSCVMLSHAQLPKNDQTLLAEVHEKYDTPFARNLESFDCAVEFSWKDHFKETTRVGDEGSDEELETVFQPIRNRVLVSGREVTVSAGMADDAISKLPHGGMAEFLLEHAVQRSLYMWLPTSTKTLLPDAGTPVSFTQSSTGYKIAYKMQAAELEIVLDSGMRLQNVALRGPQSDHIETSFDSGPQGFVLASMTQGEDGRFEKGNRLIYTYTYQTVDGVQLPERVAVVRESHHEVWRYRLKDCKVKTSK